MLKVHFNAFVLAVCLVTSGICQTTYLASEALIGGGAFLQQDPNGSYATYMHLDLASVTWPKVQVASAGWYQIVIYTGANYNSPNLNLWVNDSIRRLVRFSNSGSYTTFVPTTVYERLEAGDNKIMLRRDFWYNQTASIHKIVVTQSTEAAALASRNCKAWPAGHEFQTTTSFADRHTESSRARTQARPVGRFIESIALNSGGIERTRVYDRAKELGVRHWRIGFTSLNDSSYNLARKLHTEIGAMFNIIVDIRYQSVTDHMPLFRENHDLISSIESTNEPNMPEWNDKPTIPDWQEHVCRLQKELHDSLRADPKLRDKPILGPSLVVFDETGADAFGLGDMSAWMDYVNAHPYYGGFAPENQGWGGNGYGSVEFTRVTNSHPAPGKPIMATETGGAIADNNPDSIRVIHLPRLYAFHFNHGIDRSFWFALSDDVGGYGLLDQDDNPRPVYTTLLNMLGILRDTTTTAPAPGHGALSYKMQGDTADVEGTLLSRPDGGFDLLLWISKPFWDPNGRTATPVPERELTLSFTEDVASVRVAQPDKGETFSPVTLHGKLASVKISNHLRIFRIMPSQPSSAARNGLRPAKAFNTTRAVFRGGSICVLKAGPAQAVGTSANDRGDALYDLTGRKVLRDDDKGAPVPFRSR